MSGELLAGAATVFVVSDIAKSIDYYRDALGFTVTFDMDPTLLCVLVPGEVALHLLASRQTRRLPGNGGICVFVTDVDRLHTDLVSREPT